MCAFHLSQKVQTNLLGYTDTSLVCSPHVARLQVLVELVEPGLLGLAAFCSCYYAVFIQVQTQEH